METTEYEFSFAMEADDSQYSFAVEYDGPPLLFDLPSATPLDFDSLSVASVLAPPLEEETVDSNLLLEVSSPGGRIGPHLVRGRSEKPRNKRSCHRCFGGNRLAGTESCVVCDAKYCGRCVLKAMGVMLEGRKCLGCVGCPAAEAKKKGLGKCSRILKKLLSPAEIERVMKAEKESEASQLQAECVFVNGKELTADGMFALLNCGTPPGRLKPGRYWYDKVSGLWGKEGHKPHKIISPHLTVGGILMNNASNGTTGIFINGREITETEMQMLQLCGVHCAGNSHFRLNADGTYQEEGHKVIEGNLWDKHGVKFICSVLSLPPPPPEVSNPSTEEANDISSGSAEYIGNTSLQKLLLVGFPESGTSTIFKQAKFLYKPHPFSKEEREHIKFMIQCNTYHYLCILLEGRKQFEEQHHTLRYEYDGHEELNIYSLSSRLKDISDYLLKAWASNKREAIFPTAIHEYSSFVEELLEDASVQATCDRIDELNLLPPAAGYFLERAVEISKPEYEPSDMDILYADGIALSNRLACSEFFFPDGSSDCNGSDVSSLHEIIYRYQLIRVHSRSLGKSLKCLDMFEDARMVIFCVSLSNYDEHCKDRNGSSLNKMIASKLLFESIVTHPTFEQTNFLLILTKFDLLEYKIEHAPLNVCDWFNDYKPLRSRVNGSAVHHNDDTANNTMLAEQAFYYIAVKFKRLFASLTGRKLYVTMANGLDSCSVDNALRYAREILKWGDDRDDFGNKTDEISVYSTEKCYYSE